MHIDNNNVPQIRHNTTIKHNAQLLSKFYVTGMPIQIHVPASASVVSWNFLKCFNFNLRENKSMSRNKYKLTLYNQISKVSASTISYFCNSQL